MCKSKGLMAALLATAALVIAGIVGSLSSAQTDAGARGQWGQPLGQQAGSLNPNGFPQIAACKTIALDDPAGAAKANIAKGDLRPFTVYGFTSGDVSGVFCPSGNYRLESRGGTFVSDMPDACGSHSFSNAAADRMETYNRTLAADPRFQKVSGCRPSTYCEERYGKGYRDADQRDPRCPAEPLVLVRIAENGTKADLAEALKDFAARSPTSRDAITSAFLSALKRAKWGNAETLLRAGADINGRAFDAYPDKRSWLGSPLEAVFNQNDDKAGKIFRARWLFAHGMNFSNPGAHQSLTWAAASNDIDAVNFLLAKGASPNGAIPKEEQDRLAQGNIQSAGGGFGYGMTPFYSALGAARNRWARRTSEEIAHADREQRKGRINAVTLYRSGGRFFVGLIYDELRQSPDLKVASILLGAAHREGRREDLIERILFPSGHDAQFNPGKSGGERALIDYLRKVQACRVLRPVPKGDHVKLCLYGDV